MHAWIASICNKLLYIICIYNKLLKGAAAAAAPLSTAALLLYYCFTALLHIYIQVLLKASQLLRLSLLMLY